MQWYYAKNGQSVGPVEDKDFEALVAAQTISADTLVWNSEMTDWKPYGETPAGAAAPAAAETQGGGDVCSVCGRGFPREDMISYEGAFVCAECKPQFLQRMKEGAALPGIMDYAGFWIRVGAKMIDGIILSAVSMLTSVAAGAAGFAAQSAGSAGAAVAVQAGMAVLQMAVGVAYTVFFLGKYGATPGKMACKLRVVRADGSALTYGRACGRYFGELLSSLTLNIGYLMVAFDEEKRGLHDRVCDTRVIRVG